jgi:hypothetical protein
MLRRSLLPLATLVLLLPAAASASSFKYYGPHFGFGQGPDHTVIGGQLQWNGVAPRVAFVPSLDYGFGNANSVLTINSDLHFQLTNDMAWAPYLGAGVGIHMWSEPGGAGRGDPQTGGHLILGAAVRNGTGGRFFTEMKLGMGDSPDMKLLAGWNLRGR